MPCLLGKLQYFGRFEEKEHHSMRTHSMLWVLSSYPSGKRRDWRGSSSENQGEMPKMSKELHVQIYHQTLRLAVECFLSANQNKKTKIKMSVVFSGFVFCLSLFIETHSSLISGALALDNDDSKNLSLSSSTMSTRGWNFEPPPQGMEPLVCFLPHVTAVYK